jgi:hypothetical protein
VTCERLVDGEEFARQPELTTIPGFQVDRVVEARGGARPASCAGDYGVDEAYLADYYRAAAGSPASLQTFITERIGQAEPVGVRAR